MSKTLQDPGTDVDNPIDEAGSFRPSNHDPSDSSDSLNVLSSDGPQNLSDASHEASRKRKTRVSSSIGSQNRRKRLKPYYSDNYRELYNEVVADAVKAGNRSAHGDLKRSQIGITTWSASEKSLFFDKLARRGRGDALGIAAGIDTKSEPEVQAYLLLLEETSTEQQIYSPNESLPGLTEIPAAFEISATCESALEKAADALAVLQQNDDDKAEKHKHGERWRLTSKHGREANKFLKNGPDSEAQLAELIPETNLLDLKSFLILTERFFMNSTDPEYHWRTYAVKRSMRPSIFYTAFSDFHNLVLSLTRRLVQSAIFFAMSRLRAMDGSRMKAYRRVRRNDVTAAVNVLGMKKDGHEYWVGLARRCKLDVYEAGNSEKASKSKMSYDMVEEELDRPRKRKGQHAQTPLETSSRAESLSSDAALSPSSESASEYTTSPAESEPESESEPGSRSSSEPPLDRRSPETVQAQDLLDQEEDAYLSALDQQASLREEERLWDLLDRTPPSPIDPDKISILEEPPAKIKPLEDIGDWRKWVRYAPEWEVFGTFIPTGNRDRTRQRRYSHSDHNDATRKPAPTSRSLRKELRSRPRSLSGEEVRSMASNPTLSSADEDVDNNAEEQAGTQGSDDESEKWSQNSRVGNSADPMDVDHSEDSDDSRIPSEHDANSESSSDD